MTTTPGTELIELETGVFARLHEGLTNAGIIVGDEGVLVIDSLRVPSFARDLIRDVRHITDKPIQYLVDTHSHWITRGATRSSPKPRLSDTKTATTRWWMSSGTGSGARRLLAPATPGQKRLGS